jgi:hypothetical protein
MNKSDKEANNASGDGTNTNLFKLAEAADGLPYPRAQRVSKLQSPSESTDGAWPILSDSISINNHAS